MKRSRFSEKQIIGLLKEHQAGFGAKELCLKHSVSDFEAENTKLKNLLAEQMMDVPTLKEMMGKNS